jgi:hypothetical protein
MGHTVVRIKLCLFMVETKIFACFSPGKTVTKITPGFRLDLESYIEVLCFLLIFWGCLLISHCYAIKRGHTHKDSIRSPNFLMSPTVMV